MKKEDLICTLSAIVGFAFAFVWFLHNDPATKEMLAANPSSSNFIGLFGFPLCFAAIFGVPAGIILYLLFLKPFIKS